MKQWNEEFKKYGKIFNTPQPELIKVAEIFRKSGVKKVLDLGCGSGRHVVYLAKKGFDVYGIDIAEEGILLTKKWLKEEGLRANLKIGNIYKKLPYTNNFFEVIISTQTLHHGSIENIRKTIKEFERILIPGGYIFITFRRRKFRKFYPSQTIIEKYGKQKVSYKVIAPRTYVPIEGGEKGLPHYLFNKELINKEFKNFTERKIWVDSEKRHYCFLAKLKGDKN